MHYYNTKRISILHIKGTETSSFTWPEPELVTYEPFWSPTTRQPRRLTAVFISPTDPICSEHLTSILKNLEVSLLTLSLYWFQGFECVDCKLKTTWIYCSSWALRIYLFIYLFFKLYSTSAILLSQELFPATDCRGYTIVDSFSVIYEIWAWVNRTWKKLFNLKLKN